MFTIYKIELVENFTELDTVFDKVVDIMVGVNEFFVPTLFERLEKGETLLEKVQFAILERIEQGYYFYIVYHEDEVVAFNNFLISNIVINGENLLGFNVGTTCVHQDYRNRGIGNQLYLKMEFDAKYLFKTDVITRATWSTNMTQLYLYDKMGFSEYRRDFNMRGEGIDSVKFFKYI